MYGFTLSYETIFRVFAKKKTSPKAVIVFTNFLFATSIFFFSYALKGGIIGK